VRRTAAIIAVGALVFLAGCKAAPSGGAQATAEKVAPAQVSLSVPDGTTDLSPVQPLEIAVSGGKLGAVTVVAKDGAKDGATVEGSVAPDPQQQGSDLWTPKDKLAYGTTYTLTATAKNPANREAKASSTFTTVTPAKVSTPSIGPLAGTTVGVGMPIRVYFDQPVGDKAAVESHLKVTSSTPTDGAWSWMNKSEVHFRPSQYWSPNTHITLDANLYGVNMGNGVWGEKDRSVSFDIGKKHVSVADAAAHTLTVFDGDQAVQTYPMSAGSNANPTRNGAHVVTQSYRTITMDSSTFGLAVDAPGGYRADVEYAVRISNNGEFVHAAPWSVGQQGSSNVSHGCINLSTDRAAWFFNFSQPGDVVEVKDSVGPTLSAADGDIYDWAVPWDKWLAGSALK
jgi:lipoprotein-anchoring transpeptidase ErfK/SrfK